MRSDLVFGAQSLVPNRFLLCKLTAKATRALHRPGTRIHDTTNEVLERFSRAQSIADVQASHELALIPIQRRKAASPVRQAAISRAPARFNRVARASIEFGRLFGDSRAHIDTELVLKPSVLSTGEGLLFPGTGHPGE